jgi:hypothetical protein
MVPEKPAYFSRFAVKFAEILGAGIATAVSGYLVAHLGGYLSWPAKAPVPTVAVEAPAGGNARTPDRPRDRAAASAPAETHAAPDDRAKEPARAAAKPVEVSTPVTTAAVPADNDDKRSRGASRKPAADAHAAKPTPHETAEAKAQAQEAVEDQVRAALANVDASRTPAPNTPTPAATTPTPQTAAIPQSPPIPAPRNPATPAPAANYSHVRSAARRGGGTGSAAARHSKCRACRRDHVEPTCCRISVATTDSGGAGSADHGRDKIPPGRRRRGNLAWRAGDGRSQQ